ncbi:DUF6953 family protein [Novosphingobium resinovorum]|uniref:Uncharacterized protein n=1 Tax=Novosphingobium resinovorum TaxID=158500 RepID=A0A1D8A357_9SPHN|nr:hypothetical protein [Novosphingobium resinovorum]AOR76583.1 hypothetical protein BES08_07340 [Novosphingobium resinovorum]
MTPREAAEWMKSTVESEGVLSQFQAASELLTRDDEKLAYYDDSGNLCVGKPVLQAFLKITPDLVYERSSKQWCTRQDYHLPGRMQS